MSRRGKLVWTRGIEIKINRTQICINLFRVDLIKGFEALESVICDVIKTRLKRRDATRSKRKIKYYLKFGNPSFKIGSSTAVFYI